MYAGRSPIRHDPAHNGAAGKAPLFCRHQDGFVETLMTDFVDLPDKDAQ
jgi:hypothetical protein